MRFALYFAPDPSSLLWKLGCKWLGRDALLRKKIEQDVFTEIQPDRMYEITRIPRRYGLHATLKPPFRLAGSRNEDELNSAISAFASQWQSFSTSPLILCQINDFFCLCPESQPLQLNELAASCVEKFDSFRAPPTRLELARRRAEILTPFQKHNLANWGYPYVMDEYRFHITLTGRITDASEKKILHSLLTDIFAPVLEKPLVIESLCLFVEPAPGRSFFCSKYFPFNNDNQSMKDTITTGSSGIPNQEVNKSEHKQNI